VSRAGAPAQALTPMALPNGTAVLQLNPEETSLQYRDIVATRAYLQHGLALAPGAVVFDVGANIGISALFFHWEAADVTVHAFEPAPLMYEALVRNVAAHGVRGATYRCALGREPGTARLAFYPLVTAMSSLYADRDHDAEVTRTFLVNSGFDQYDVDDLMAGRHVTEEQACEVRTLSDVVAEAGVDRIDLLKINVEKAECDVMAGIAEADWPRVRQLVMQVHDLDGRVAAVERDLAARGYEVTVDQDPLLAGTDVFDLFARRP
jgi:31-O-methyltransferase